MFSTLSCQLNDQKHESKKCCSRLREKIEDVKDEVEEVETLVLSQIDQSAACCSLLDTLIVSQIDQAAICCSVTNGLIGTLDGSAIDPTCGQLFNIVSFVDGTTNLDIIQWLKSLYVLVARTYLCACTPCD